MKITLILLILSIPTFAPKKAETKDWTPIFNGKDLSGWDIKISGQPLNDNYKNTFRVEDGMMRIMYDQYQNFEDKYGHIYFKKPYSYYIVRFKYRFQGNQTPGGASWNVRNSGIMLHSQSAQSMTYEQTFPMSLEMQLLGGLGKGERHTGNLCSPGTQVYMKGSLRPAHCIDSDSKTYDGDQWVDAEAIVLGDSVVHHVINGDTVLTYNKTQIGGGFVDDRQGWGIAKMDDATIETWKKKDGMPLKSGYIAMQAESHPIDFKNIEVLNLEGCTDPKALNYKSYFIKSNKSVCRYKKRKV
ncbi:MAG: hypothetical protein RLZZ306_35 [Bacteroidota bacterium]|jgi:hypothetical protein